MIDALATNHKISLNLDKFSHLKPILKCFKINP